MALSVLVIPDPGSSAADARVVAGATVTHVARDGHATVTLVPGTYEVRVEKTGFIPVRTQVVVTARGAHLRIVLHAAATSALRTIGAVAAGQRGAFNSEPAPVAVVPREAFRDQGQPGTAVVLAQTPALTIDRAGRGLGPADAPPVALVRGGTPLETEILIEGDPVALATTRTVALSAIPAFVTQEIEVSPGLPATLAAISGDVNGALNVRFAEPSSGLRALPEVGLDSRGGSFADIAASAATADRKIGVAVVATTSGANADVSASDVTQRAVLLKSRVAFSPAATLTATQYGESDADAPSANRFDFTGADYRLVGNDNAVSARYWHVGASRNGAAAGDPLETQTTDTLDGFALEVDRAHGNDLFSAGLTATYGQGSAAGAIRVGPGASERTENAFVRAIVHPAPHWEAQYAAYATGTAVDVDARVLRDINVLQRFGLAYHPSARTALRASVGGGVAPPSLVALAGLHGRLGANLATTVDVGIEQRVVDAITTLSADVFATHEENRLVETVVPFPGWVDAGNADRHGLEISLARRPRAGFGYLVQGWTVRETPLPFASAGDIGSGATHGYAELSYHAPSGSRVSFGATYLGADGTLGQPARVLFNTNVELQVGLRGKLQLSVENLNDAGRAVPAPALPMPAVPNAFALGPRTIRLLFRRSIGNIGSDG